MMTTTRQVSALRGLLNGLLEKELECTCQLTALLEKESAILAAHDPAELEKLTSEKQDLVTQLENIARERERLFNTSGTSNNFNDIITFMDNSALASLWQNLLDQAAKCRDLNQVNSLIIMRGYQNTRHALDILHGKTAEPELYTASGDTSRKLTGRSLAQA